MDEDLLAVFMQETREHLDSLEPALLALEIKKDDKDGINVIFRAVHSIKGASGFFGFDKMTKLAHSMENMMSLIREGKLEVTNDIIDALLAGGDKLRAMTDDIEHQADIDISSDVIHLGQLIENSGKAPAATLGEVIQARKVKLPPLLENFNLTSYTFQEAVEQGHTLYVVKLFTHKDIKDKGKTPLDFFKEIDTLGEFIDAYFEIAAVEGLSNALEEDLCCKFLFSTLMQPDLVYLSFDVPVSQIEEIPREGIDAIINALKENEDAEEKSVGAKKTASTHAPTTAAKTETAAAPTEVNEVAAPPPPPIATPIHEEVAAPTTELVSKNVKKVDDTIRVSVSLLDDLMNLAGEMVLGRNQLMRLATGIKEEVVGFSSVLQNINLITSEMQEKVMLTRLQPISILFNKFSRIIRDLSQKLNKEVKLKLIGEEVELDKSIIEALSDPLTHIVRNCVDHGLETPAERERAGKSRIGDIIMEARHIGGQVQIEISDDGRGINLAKVKAKAIDRGFIRQEEADKMTESQLLHLVFLPGLSTAQEISDVSGRGVGMDVVRTNIENLNGSVDIDSKQGQGTRILLRLPLTLAIIPAMIIGAHNRRFAVPQVNLEEIVKLGEGHVVESVRGSSVLRLREKLLPLVNLAQLLGISKDDALGEETNARIQAEIAAQHANETALGTGDTATPFAEGSPDDTDNNSPTTTQQGGFANILEDENNGHVLVLKVDKNNYGLVVGELFDSEEIVVKPLSAFFKDAQCYAGATIMGDGKVAMILDADAIAQIADLKFEDFEKENSNLDALELERIRKKGEKQSLLLFKHEGTEVFALNLSMVARIEKIKKSEIEHIGSSGFIKYGDSSLRLVFLNEHMPVSTPESLPDILYIIVPQMVKRPMGIVATEIVDVVDAFVSLDSDTITGVGILGSSMLNGHLTVFLNIYSLFEHVDPSHYKAYAEESKDMRKVKVLIAEDTAFFRAIEIQYLSEIFEHIDVVLDGVDAWEKLNQEKDYDLLLTDIEMPRMNGFELTQRCRLSTQFKNLPIVALTSMSSEENKVKGSSVGFDAYEIKLDKEKLHKTLMKVVAEKIKK